MKPIKVFRVLARRRLVVIGAVIVLILAVSLVFGANLLRKTKQAKAFQSSVDSLIIGQNDAMYIGAGGKISQRFYSSVGLPTETAKYTIPLPGVAPTDGIYSAGDVQTLATNLCPDRDQGSYETCAYIASNGTGMIIHFNKSIEIDGTLFIGDRVVLDAPNITIGAGGKIYANGQDGHLGYGDSCGVGGVGGIFGGSSGSDNHSNTDPNAGGHLVVGCANGQNGQSGIQNLSTLNNAVANYFTVNGQQIKGGDSGASSSPVSGISVGIAGTAGDLGAGGGGPSGATGESGGSDHGSSGGGGGGFGLVFASSVSINIASGASITTAGGNSLLNPSDPKAGPGISMQESGHNNVPVGGFGGPGGGGVIIISSPSVNFTNVAGDSLDPDYSIFKINGGQFDYSSNQTLPKVPGKAKDGKLILDIGSGITSVKKSLINFGSDGQVRPNYVFRSGDLVQVTLDVSNLLIGQPVTIKDEIFSDNVNTATVVDNGGGVVNISKSPNTITWTFSASQITKTGKTLVYKIRVN